MLRRFKEKSSIIQVIFIFLFDVEFWLLDEPTNELDQKSIILFNKLIKNF